MPEVNLSEVTEYGDGSHSVFFVGHNAMAEPLKELGIERMSLNHFNDFYKLVRDGVEERHFNVIFVIEGELELKFPVRNFNLKAGDCAFVPSWLARRLELVKGERYVELYFKVNIRKSDKIKELDALVFESQYGLKMAELLHEAKVETDEKLPHQAKVLQSYFQLIASYFYRECCKVNDTFMGATEEKLKSFWQEVQTQIAHPWTAEELATEFGSSRAQFYRLIQKHYLCTPQEYLRNMRLKKVKDLLLKTEHTLDHIAYLTGYKSAYSLSQSFNKFVGKRPGQFRRDGA